MGGINYIERFWALGKKEEEVKNTGIIHFELPGDMRMCLMQIPPEEAYDARCAGEIKYVCHKGYGHITADDGSEENINTGRIIYLKPGLGHSIKNNSAACTLEILAVSHNEKITEKNKKTE